MGYRYEEFAPGEIYHVCTRSVEGRDIFLSDVDRKRFLSLLIHCLPRGHAQSYSTAKRFKQRLDRTSEGSGLVDIMCYCLMTNHAHLLLKENIEHGISGYMQKLLNSYARYFNVRRSRKGSLFAGPFRAVGIDGDEQLLHVSRYIHLNPYMAYMIKDPFSYSWSSLGEYVGRPRHTVCHTSLIRGMMKPSEYRVYITDEADYARELADIRHLLLEEDV